MFNAITLLYNPTTDNKFVVKYRTNRVEAVYFDITWVSQKSFTTTQVGIVAGDEITIIQGKGSGRIAHVSSVSGTSTFTVVLDETIEIVNGTARARLEKWKKLGEITSTSRHFATFPASATGTWIEIKVAMLGTTQEVLIEDIDLSNKKQQ